LGEQPRGLRDVLFVPGPSLALFLPVFLHQLTPGRCCNHRRHFPSACTETGYTLERIRA
jgi:hypothetical protein